MTHVNLSLGWILQHLRVVDVCLLYQNLTYQDLDSLITEEVLQQLLLVLSFELVDRYLIQILHLNLVWPDAGAFHILQHR